MVFRNSVLFTSRDDQSYFAFVDTPRLIPYPHTSGASRPDFPLWTSKFPLPDTRVLYVDNRMILSYRKGFAPGLGLPSDFQSIDHSSWIHRQNRWLAPHADAPAIESIFNIRDCVIALKKVDFKESLLKVIIEQSVSVPDIFPTSPKKSHPFLSRNSIEFVEFPR